MSLQLRPAQASDATTLAEIHVSVWRQTYHGILPQDQLDRLNIDERRQAWQQQLDPLVKHPFFTWLAERQGQILGFATGGPNRAFHPTFKNWFDHADLSLQRFQGELNAIYVRIDAQGQGTGRALFNAVAQDCEQQNMQGLLCWVLPENRNLKFYERLGGKITGKGQADINGPREMWAYTWDKVSL